MIGKATQEGVRIDKWLWAVRICKTRMIAKDLCDRKRVSIDGQEVKSSRIVQGGQLIEVRREGLNSQYQVLKCIDKRVSATVASECCRDLTPKEEKDKQSLVKSSWVPRRAKGEGRPTKKERRAVDRLLRE